MEENNGATPDQALAQEDHPEPQEAAANPVDLNVPANWNTDSATFVARPEQQCQLIGGATSQHPEDARPLSYFNLLWTDDWWAHMVRETNMYADQQDAGEKWSPVTVRLMQTFIGLMLGMGIMKMNVMADYWRQTKRLFRTQFGTVMARDAYLKIWRYLHLADNTAPRGDNPDKLYKLRPLIDHLNQKFRENYVPYRDVAVDESMVKFKGRLGFRQYLPAKPIKWGIKVWAMSESTTGYMCSFQIYTGKEAGQEHGLAHRVVKDLLVHYHNTGIRVYMDNFYTSVPLLRDLAGVGIAACGTVRANRRFLPAELLPKRVTLHKHQHRSAQSEGLTFVVWQDTKAVSVLSNFHNPNDRGIVRRRAGRQEQQNVEVPLALADYQRCMMGVDLTDQMLGYYMQEHKTRKWWRRCFIYLTMVSAHNAYILARDSNPDYVRRAWPGFKDFLEDLVEDLTSDARTSRAPPILLQPRPGNQLHTVAPRADGKFKRCHECREQGVKQTTNFMCQICDIAIHKKCLQSHQKRMLRD